jgi:Zn-dependent membrane protease YugP
MIRDWSAFVALVLLGWLLRSFVSSAYRRLKKRIDDAVPDHLPIGGGAWLRERLPDGVRLIVTNKHDENAYIPSARVITLSREVDYKRDASFWATAAHELGHALFYRTTFFVHGLFLVGRTLVYACTTAGTFLVFANVLYARADVNKLAFTLLEVSLASWLLVLMDEAIASVIAVRLLVADARVDRRDMVGAVTSLLAGFMTYVAAFVGQVILVLERDFIVGTIERHRHFTPAAPMDGGKLVAVGALGALLTVWAVYGAIRAVRKRDAITVQLVTEAQASNLLNDFGRALLGCLIVWLVWDQPGDLVPLVSVVGLLGSRGPLEVVAGLLRKVLNVVVFLLLVPFIIGFAFFFSGLFKRIVGEKEDKIELPPDSHRTKTALERMEIDAYNHASLPVRLGPLTAPLLHLAFAAGLVAVLVGAR